MRALTELSPLELVKRRARHEEHEHVVEALLSHAKHKTHEQLIEDLTEPWAGNRRFCEDPPILTRVPELQIAGFVKAYEQYRATLPPAIRASLLGFRLVDAAFKVVGVGSVGLAAYVVLLATGDHQHFAIWQLKEARESSVGEALRAAGLPEAPWAHQGQRIVEGQRAMQSIDDPYVGYTTLDSRHFMVRRLAENKVAIDDASMHGGGLLAYAKAAATVFAYSHAVTGDPVAIAGYLGSSDAFDHFLSKFAVAYADQTTDDHAAFARRLRAAAAGD
jgi:uncharacterized protein (DUF2252 family)